ncbi:MAG: hypothetical protein ACLTBV_21135 [Enterocloster bolteae]
MILCMAVFAGAYVIALPERLQLAASGSRSRCLPPSHDSSGKVWFERKLRYMAPRRRCSSFRGFCSGGSDLLWYAVKGRAEDGTWTGSTSWSSLS